MQGNQKLIIDPFCYNQFETGNSSSVPIGYDRNEFQNKMNELYNPKDLIDGYAPFCKHLIVKNFTGAKLGAAEINSSNEHLLRSTYEARTELELPVLVRFFPKDSVKNEVAEYLDVILYSKEQIQKENEAMGKKDPNANVDYDWGIIYIKPQNADVELPMSPITMMRNALGKEHGGSGVPLDREKYQESVDFWSKWALIN